MTLKTQMESDLDSIFFNTDEFAKSVTYIPLGSILGETVKIIINASDESLQDPQPAADEMIIEVQESEVASPNAQGDTFTIDGETWYLIENLAGPKATGIWRLRLTRSERRQL